MTDDQLSYTGKGCWFLVDGGVKHLPVLWSVKD